MASLLLAIVLPFGLILISTYAFQLMANARRRLPPGPLPLPVIGNLLTIGRGSPHRSLARLAERYGPLMSLRLGVVHAVVVSSSSAAREVLQRHNAVLADRPVIDAWLANGHRANSIIALPPHAKWRALRRLCATELFAPGRLDALGPLRQRKRDAAPRLRAGGAPAAMNILSRMMFSVDLDSGPPPSPGGRRGLSDAVKEATILAATPNVSDFFPAIAAADLQGLRCRMGPLVADAHKILDELFAQRLLDREACEPPKNDMLDAVLDKEHEWQQEATAVGSWTAVPPCGVAGETAPFDELGGDSVSTWELQPGLCAPRRAGTAGSIGMGPAIFSEDSLEGADTSSTTVEWAMAALLKNPQVMEKVKGELMRVLGNKTQVEESDIAQLPYLQAVVKEVLRLYPSVATTFYRAEATVQVQGYTIPEGTTIILNIWAVHRDADVWTDPEKFMPERFMDGGSDFSSKDCKLIPFGGGRRICIGLPLAYRTVHLILASLLHQFDWILPEEAMENGVDMTEKFGLVISMATPLKAIAKKRDM
ncbi:LOW QUALITY PROTEIN: hypothetical protein SETIT_1G166100v2 [Setaria italica]|uniref:Cytochrome P450 n=2 Tax=Setaria italica TaxID=4555 RepID=A0A368PL16_SETIT|nr:LOW QUALITY PROTEIN: hypothetical protein SETIT_1G166100v2 [Setaria italica]